MNRTVEQITDRVQLNCHISDARHGADYGLCTYLLKMREYFRWEKRMGFAQSLSNDEVGEWLTEREQLWAGLEALEYSPIVIDGRDYDPFDIQGINQALSLHGLVYSSGVGRSGRTHFFLAELEQQKEREGYSIFVSGREYARDLTAPPAMMRREVIFIRRESLRRMLWEKLESWRWNRPDNALGRAFACYDFEQDLDDSLVRMTENEMDLLLLHEQGEHQAGVWLGDGWEEMLADLLNGPLEIAARAIRDNLADCMVTIPSLTKNSETASFHFFIGNLSAMRQKIFPELKAAYDHWLQTGEVSLIQDAASRGEVKWKTVARSMLDLHAEYGSDSAQPIREMLERRIGL